MIKFYDQVPSVYNNASRDFQYLSWLINVVLNSVKHNVDDMYDLPNTKADPRLTELLAMTLGFKVKRNYDKKQLAALVRILPSILKCKGTSKAINLAGNALLTASGASADFESTMVNNCLEVTLPETLVDTTLFTDLLPYILPAGLTCRVVRKSQNKRYLKPIEIEYQNKLLAKWQSDEDLAGIFDVDKINSPEFTNYKTSVTEDPLVLNAGLMDNTVIPLLDRSLSNPMLELDYVEKPNNQDTTVVINNNSAENND